MLKTSNNKWRRRRRQQQSGRTVLVTFYVVHPRRRRGSSATRGTSSHTFVGHHHHRQHRRHNLHGGHHDDRSGRNGGKFPDNRRAHLLEYSRQLRALARQATTAPAAPPPPSPLPRLLQRHDIHKAVAIRGEEGHLAAVNRHLVDQRAMSQQQIRQPCFGRDGWSWKRVLVLIFPVRSKNDGVVGRGKPRRPMRMDGDDSERNRENNQKGWPAAVLVGKLTVTKSRREHGGFAKKLMSIFQKRSR